MNSKLIAALFFILAYFRRKIISIRHLIGGIIISKSKSHKTFEILQISIYKIITMVLSFDTLNMARAIICDVIKQN